MRSLALTALLGSFVASTCVVGQSLTEHAAAAAGATIGTAAGKPLGTSLGKIFGEVDTTASKAATPKTAKPIGTNSAPAKPAPIAPPQLTEHASTPVVASGGGGGDTAGGGGGGGGDTAGGGGGGGGGGSSHHSARRRERPVDSEAEVPAPVIPEPVVPVVAPLVVKEPTVQDVASIKVGATASELHAVLGPPESRVSIPGDDGHLLEICQYWAKGEPLGTIRLDNGRVISVQAHN